MIAAVVSPVSALVIGALILMFILILGIVMLAAALKHQRESTRACSHRHGPAIRSDPRGTAMDPADATFPRAARGGGALHQYSLSAPLRPKDPGRVAAGICVYG
ncbi:MAG: hypothetical protein M3R63_12985 [Actinomycetota bacterium]|nr:hypothetical protein [Actinomycetota bacterium]